MGLAAETGNPTSPFPSFPLGDPFAADGSRLIYIAKSCDAAPSLPSFVLSTTSPPDSNCSNWKDKQFYQSRKLDRDVKLLHLSVCVIHYLWYSELKLLRADPTDLQMVKIGKLAKAESRWARMQSKSTNCAFLFRMFTGWCTKMASTVQRSM